MLEIEAPSKTPEATIDDGEDEVSFEELAHVDILTKPLEDLPPIGDYSEPGEPFWCRRQLRPEGEGSNFHNFPILQFGIRYDHEQGMAVLTVPKVEYINFIVEKYNPGGFTFEPVHEAGADTAAKFFERLSRGAYPSSEDREIDNSALADKYKAFLVKSERAVWPTGPTMSPYEHDLVDHAGIIALPADEVNKIMKTAEKLLDIDPMDQPYACGCMDRLMDLLSAYAIASDIYSVEHKDSYKDALWKHIVEYEQYIGAVLGGADLNMLDDHVFGTREQRTKYKKYCAEALENNQPILEIDRDAFDKKIQELREVKV